MRPRITILKLDKFVGDQKLQQRQFGRSQMITNFDPKNLVNADHSHDTWGVPAHLRITAYNCTLSNRNSEVGLFQSWASLLPHFTYLTFSKNSTDDIQTYSGFFLSSPIFGGHGDIFASSWSALQQKLIFDGFVDPLYWKIQSRIFWNKKLFIITFTISQLDKHLRL